MGVMRKNREPFQLRQYNRANYRAQIRRRMITFCGVFGLIGFGLFFLAQQVEAPTPSDLHLPFKTPQSAKPAVQYTASPEWPEGAAAMAIGVHGQGVIATNGDKGRRPIASVAKVITSLALIEKYNLKPGQSGPSIPFTAADEAVYQQYAAKNGAVVPVPAGQSLTLRKALEAMILPSANNIADAAATWGFGSMAEYHKYATRMLKKYGLKNTTVGGDASGFDPKTQSTSEDLIKLGELALNAPVLMEIAGQHSTELPGIGVIESSNRLVTNHGYTGLKAGDTDEAGRTLVFTTKHVVNGKEVNLIGAVLGVMDPQKSPYDLGFTAMESAKRTLHTK